MDIVKIIELIASILAGVAVCLPLVLKLIQYVKEAAKGKDYQKLIKLTMKFCEEAELLFGTGQERKEWVLHRVEEIAKAMNIEVDMDAISQLIDDICEASKIINAKTASDGKATK